MSEAVLEEARRNKLNFVREYTNPYPERFEKNYEITQIKDLEDGTSGVRTAGRIRFMRKMGKLSFISIADVCGSIQVAIKKDSIGEEAYEFFKKGFDLGDFIGVEGEMFTTQAGEKTIRATHIEFLGKSLKPLPEKFHGITDIDSCYRQRYLDLLMNEDTRSRFLLKANFVKEVRRFLEDEGYIEIETPALINKPSGATAKPFVSHYNALDMQVYMRIAPETYLKRAIVGGFTKVFEFARCFRNEGMDATHLQDFTMLEENPEVVDRFQLIINGAEVINAYSELVDPQDQKQRLLEQAKLKADGDEEAMTMDTDYIEAMEYGMPPISGWGMGIDRMLQVLTGQDNIRDLIMFPMMRPLEK